MITRLFVFCIASFLVHSNLGVAQTHDFFDVKKCSEVAHDIDAKALLPECLVSQSTGEGDVKFAYYAQPTNRYGHGILGDGIEAGSLVVIDQKGKKFELSLPSSEVFEDLFPRIVDLDRDGLDEIITIRSSVRVGAAVTIYGFENGQLIEKATTDFHGLANRWLNIAGFGDFFGKGKLELAFVRTPHIGGTLYFYEYDDGDFQEVAQISGFSNHAIGSRELGLSAVGDFDKDGRDEILVPSNSRQTVRFIEIEGDRATEYKQAQLPSGISKSFEMKIVDGKAVVQIGLSNSTTIELIP